MYTTNDEDKREAEKLQARLASGGPSSGTNTRERRPSCSIDPGANKYVLISAVTPGGGERQNFVISKLGAHYHCNVAEPVVDDLERSGYESIRILGGGRINRNDQEKTIAIYGFSYSFGRPDHTISAGVVEADYKDYTVTTSNEGY